MTEPIKLPPLPAGYAPEVAAAMRNYARAAIEADRQNSMVFECGKAAGRQEVKDEQKCPDFWTWIRRAYREPESSAYTVHNMEVAYQAGRASVEADRQANQITGETSDGYHTFNELYAHRVRLFCLLMHAHKGSAWWSRKHHDGIAWEGWVIAGIDTPEGSATYHLPESEIENLPEGTELPNGKEWDGHTSDDVLVRLLSLRQARGEPVGNVSKDSAVAHMHVNLPEGAPVYAVPQPQQPGSEPVNEEELLAAREALIDMGYLWDGDQWLEVDPPSETVEQAPEWPDFALMEECLHRLKERLVFENSRRNDLEQKLRKKRNG